MTYNFSTRVRRILSLAREEALRLRHESVGTEHILMALLREDESGACSVLENLGIERERVALSLAQAVPAAGDVVTNGDVSFTSQSKKVLELAMAEARVLGHRHVGTEHLLLGLMREEKGLAAQVLVTAGVALDRLQAEVAKSSGAGLKVGTTSPPTPPGKPDAVSSAEGLRTPALDRFCRDLTAMARAGELDPLIGREAELARVVQILLRRRKNNPVLVGEPGVGKTAIVDGLAHQIVQGQVPQRLARVRLLSLDLGALVAGTRLRGDFEERLTQIIEETRTAGNVILVIDELHRLIGTGSAESSADAANLLKPVLARGDLQVIGATTTNEYRRHIERDGALERRFQRVSIAEPAPAKARAILDGLRRDYEYFHDVVFSPEALAAAVELSVRYINDRRLPDKALDLLDEAAACVRIRAESTDAPGTEDVRQTPVTVRVADVAEVVSRWTGVPAGRLSSEERERVRRLERDLLERVVGQADAVRAVARVIRRRRAGFSRPRRPIGCFLFVGPTGVGKTELARSLAEVLFGDRDAIIRFDMSEYMERFSVSKLIGAPPGYVGHESGGQLAKAVRERPYSVVLLDEIEKAHSDVLNVLLQVMDDGRLTDSHGHTIDFRNVVLIMTSNVGVWQADEKKSVGFLPPAEAERMEHEIGEAIEREFAPEFRNRLDEIVRFKALSERDMRSIARLMLSRLSAEVEECAGARLEVEEAVVDWLAARGHDVRYGARPLRRLIEREIEDRLADLSFSYLEPVGPRTYRVLLDPEAGGLRVEDDPCLVAAALTRCSIG